MWLIVISAIVLVAISVFLLSIKVIFVKNSKFPSTHVGGQKALVDKGISCHTSQHRDAQNKKKLEDIYSEL